MAVIALAVAMLLALPGAVAAKPRRFVEPDSFELTAQLPKSHGYTVAITSSDHRHIQLLAGKGRQLASYSVVGRANRNRLDADFGRFGKIRLRFDGQPSKSGEGRPPFCHGKPSQLLVGTLRGKIRFRGTNGFIEIDAQRARAVTFHSPRQVCERHGEQGGKEVNSIGVVPEPHPHSRLSPQRLLRRLDRAKPNGDEAPALQLLVAKRRTATGKLELGAFSVPQFLGIVVADAQESFGRVRVERGAVAVVDPAMLKVDKPAANPRRATLQLPKPFSGRGNYVESPGTEPSWTGSLRVHLPGEARVSLTGPEFDVDVCRARTKPEVESCSKLIR